jgi:four helix bundle protein
MGVKVRTHRDLEVYQRAFEVAMNIFQLSKSFPKEEKYSLVDQVRRSSRSVCAILAEACRRRRYEGVFLNKLSEAEGEAAETQVWIEFAVHCEYLGKKEARPLYSAYNKILATLVGMINHPETWTLPPPTTKRR